jgi:hypothetical protein
MLFAIIFWIVSAILICRVISFLFVTFVCIPENIDKAKDIILSHWKKHRRS